MGGRSRETYANNTLSGDEPDALVLDLRSRRIVSGVVAACALCVAGGVRGYPAVGAALFEYCTVGIVYCWFRKVGWVCEGDGA